MRQAKIPTILGIVVLVAGLVAGVMVTRYAQILRTQAAPDTKPADLRITNVAGNSFTVSWTTSKPTLATIDWGVSPALGDLLPSATPELSFTHFFTIRGLATSKKYYFKIISDGITYDNNGAPWEVTTAANNTENQGAGIMSGTVTTADGARVKNVLVYVTMSGAASLSAQTSETGSWVIPTNIIRSTDLSKPLVPGAQTVVQIIAQSGPTGTSSAQAMYGFSSSIPAMILGQNHDFRTTPGTDSAAPPTSSINVGGTNATPTSKIKLDPDSAKASPGAQTELVTLNSVDDGEIITTESPEFFGEGPAGLAITITVESTPQSTQLAIPANGDWKWNPPQDLEPGSHKVTISWKDAAGILRQLTRTFVVSAQEGPAFESSQSGSTPTPVPTSSPTALPTPSSAPTSTASSTSIATASATSSPRVAIPATDAGTPVAGVAWPGMAILVLGIVFLTSAVWLTLAP